jgi:hypothetical protein
MRLTSEFSHDLTTAVARHIDEMAIAVRSAVLKAATSAQIELRAQVEAAGLGRGLANAWRLKVYPSHASLKTAGLVYSNATLLHRVFDQGAYITHKHGRFLAIPTPEAIAMGFGDTKLPRPREGVAATGGHGGTLRRAAQIEMVEKRLGKQNLFSIPLSGGRQLLIYRAPNRIGKGEVIRGSKQRGLGVPRGGSVPLFILVPSVTLTKRIDIDGAHARALDKLATELRVGLGEGAV